ncbi:SDR family oxidoreductase [Solirubrobacter ginsenosidimutans]|uniref:SDR family oxidoreductase n=1 Tax=Solirubrobacter ginsenosidimutans TaxID=490573 RepID=A0A9X3MZD0_9ACTN|nr:SDR family oxidoreductase [Solirubrobacter ginsenosidimutans]MDA0165312.1 SDR family oxidoreductase [Solirubrobacter ginsenosidimutans]
MDLGLEGKVVLVTGAASGIGRATAKAFAGEGATLALVDRDAGGLHSVREEIVAAGGRATTHVVDVSDSAEVDDAHDEVAVEHGRIDVAFNNAGVIEPVGWFHETPEGSWDRVIGVNLKGVWLCMRAQLRHMYARRDGVIVNTSSAAGLVGAPGTSPYTTAKHGVIGLTRTAALEYATSGIRVNAVAPGTVATPMNDSFARMENDPFADAPVRHGHPNGRLARPDEIADAVLFLASGRSTFATGSTLVVDGGYTAQ